MPNPQIFVPYSINRTTEPFASFELYTVQSSESSRTHGKWMPYDQRERDKRNNKDNTKKKLDTLQLLFKQEGVGLEFQLIKDIKNINEAIIHDGTPSVFLGIYLTLLQKINKIVFNNEWTSITSTGDIKIIDNIVYLEDVTDIEEKYKYFKTDILKEYPNIRDKHLFIYVSEQPIKDIKSDGNIIVRHFSTKDTIDSVEKCVFELNLDELQLSLINNMKSQNKKDYGYIPTKGIDDLINVMLNDSEWPSLFLYGEGGTGKSATAMALANHLIWLGRTYAPIWVHINNSDINKLFTSNNDKKRQKEIQEDFINKIFFILKGKIDFIDFSQTLKLPLLEKEIALEKILNKNRYLIVIDNLEIRENDIKYILDAVHMIFQNYIVKPYLIITSRAICNISNTFISQITEVPKFDKKEQIIIFIENIAKRIKVIEEKLNTSKNNYSFLNLVDVVFEKLYSFPELIILAIISLQDITATVDGLIEKIKKNSENEFKVEIYKTIFSYLDELPKQIIYYFLNFPEEVSLSIDRIIEGIKEFECWKKIHITKNKLEEAINTLGNYSILSINNSDNNEFSMKSIAYYTFLFEKEFIGKKTLFGKYQRDIFISLDWQITIALEKDQGIKIIKPLLRKIIKNNTSNLRQFYKNHIKNGEYIKNGVFLSYKTENDEYVKLGIINKDDKNNDITKILKKKFIYRDEYYLIAARYSTKPEIFSLFRDIGYDIYACDEFSGNLVFNAIKEKNIIALELLFENAQELFNYININKDTVFHYAVLYGDVSVLNILIKLKNAQELLNEKDHAGRTVFFWPIMYEKIDILEWLLKNVKNKNELLRLSDNSGENIFSWAAGNKNDFILDWILENVKNANELLYDKNNKGGTIFHHAAHWGNEILLNWLFKKAEDLLYETDDMGRTVFFEAVSGRRINVLNWLYDKIPKLLEEKSKNGDTIFHYAVYSSSPYILDWLYKHIDNAEEFLKIKNNNGETVFHSAMRSDKINNTNWLYNKVPKLINCTDNEGKTVFHNVAEWYGSDDIFEWLLENASEMLNCRDIHGNTFVHNAAKEGNIYILDWLFNNYKKLEICKDKGIDAIYTIAEQQGNNDSTYYWLMHKGYFNENWEPVNSAINEDSVIRNISIDLFILDWLHKYAPKMLKYKDKDAITIFQYAIENNNNNVINWFYERFGDKFEAFIKKYNSGKSISDCTTESDSATVLNWLSKYKPILLMNVNNIKKSILHYAVKAGNTEILNWFLINIPDLLLVPDNEGRRITHFAALHGKKSVFNWFLEHAPGLLNCKDNQGRNVSLYARRWGNNNVVEWFFNLNWFFTYIPDFIKNSENTDFLLLATWNNIAILNWYFSNTSELYNCYKICGKKSFDWFFKYAHKLLNSADNYGRTIFHHAAAEKKAAVFEWLYGYKTELLNSTDKDGATVFHYAAGWGSIATLELLVKHSKEMLNSINNHGGTAFHYASKGGNLDALKWFYQNARELINCVDNIGGTVFHHATQTGNDRVLNWLFDYVPELLKCKDNEGCTVFHYAADGKNTVALEWLWEHRFFMEQPVIASYTETPTELLSNYIDNTGRTVFHIAAGWGNVNVFEWFWFNKDISKLINNTDNDGKNVYHYAKIQNNTAILEWIKEHIPELIIK